MSFNVNGNISVASYKFKWVINDFSTSCRHVGEALYSPPFFGMKDIQCTLKLYPKGENEESRDIFSLVLPVHGKIEGTVTLQILNNKGEAVVSHTAEGRPFIKGCYLHEYKKYGLLDFIIDPANGILDDDKMIIMCKITQLTPEEMKKRSDKHKNREEMWQGVVGRLEEIDKYECLINENKFSDVTLITEGRVLKVHKCILAKSSLVFAAMFEAEMLEKQDSSVEIEDIRYDVLLEMIRFIYVGKVKNMDDLAGELLAAADKYALEKLMVMCEDTMCKNLNVDNVIEYVVLADVHRMYVLKKKSIEFILAYANDVANGRNFKSLPYDLLCEVCCAMSKKIKL
ncbi:speckle-type POZ protein-like [Nasonia vitripennis]|uniref:Uncharacterized protein n=1 Tax=Nasonia vitripennis TaxID=7425 RepID=A0A7M7QGP4_NASVI|nr:speckle-type POZ protein-like [Nasonia vitripennis]